uniref:PLDc N-terminal domain-containing protein n=1 Tax=Aliarcobacter sp. TaxID=2321116 RepID=UPI004048E846
NDFFITKKKESFIPKFFITQILIHLVLITIIFTAVNLDQYNGRIYHTEMTDVIILLMITNITLFWLYSFISILKNDFKKENEKYLWIFILIFVPFITPFIYPDFKKRIIIEED